MYLLCLIGKYYGGQTNITMVHFAITTTYTLIKLGTNGCQYKYHFIHILDQVYIKVLHDVGTHTNLSLKTFWAWHLSRASSIPHEPLEKMCWDSAYLLTLSDPGYCTLFLKKLLISHNLAKITSNTSLNSKVLVHWPTIP